MIQQKADVYLHSSLENHVVEKTLLRPAGNLEKLVEKLVRKYGEGARICVLPEGPHTIPYIAPG